MVVDVYFFKDNESSSTTRETFNLTRLPINGHKAQQKDVVNYPRSRQLFCKKVRKVCCREKAVSKVKLMWQEICSVATSFVSELFALNHCSI